MADLPTFRFSKLALMTSRSKCSREASEWFRAGQIADNIEEIGYSISPFDWKSGVLGYKLCYIRPLKDMKIEVIYFRNSAVELPIK